MLNIIDNRNKRFPGIGVRGFRKAHRSTAFE